MKVDKWTGQEKVSITQILTVLNGAAKSDPEMMSKLCLTRFPCNKAIRDHETIQAHCYGDASLENPKVGFIGILNGLIGQDKNGFGAISAVIDKDVVVGFKLTDTAAFDKQD